MQKKLKQSLAAIGRVPLISMVMEKSATRQALESIPIFKQYYANGLGRRHPFDRVHGTDTSGYVPIEEIVNDENPASRGLPYGGSQPSILRQVLATLPNLKTSTFIDIGCGKGRPLLVASEFPFRDIIGVELSPRLADVARRNAAIIARGHPLRTKVTVETCDATQYRLPAGDLTIFLYNPFPWDLMAQLVSKIEAALAAEPRQLYVLYYNPVSGACFDASPHLRRRLARMFPYEEEELGYGPDINDALVVWQNGSAPPSVEPADAQIIVTTPGWRAELAR